jgi:enterochelin esterase-like enzyme
MSPKRLPLYIIPFLVLVALSCMPARSAQVCPEIAGKIERGTYRSQIAQTNMYYSVYTPPCYASSGAAYPVVYLMHGSNEDDGHWIRLGIENILNTEIVAGTLPPMVVVMPFGEWIANQNQFDTVSWENVFLKELMPLIESSYRLDDRRAIGGISRGGFWAYEIAFRHPDLFTAVGGHSAYFDPGHAPDDYNPLDLALNAPDIEKLRLWLDRGPDDFAAPGLDRMDANLTERGLTYEYRLYDEGQHNNNYWRQHVGDYMSFYAADWLNAAPSSPPVVFATNTPAALPTPLSTSREGQGVRYSLFLPAVAFPSLQTALPDTQIWNVRVGGADSKLVVSESVAIDLMRYDVTLAPEIRIVPDAALLNTLWSDRTLYTLLPFDKLTTRYRVLHINDQHPLDGDLSAYPFAFPSDQPNYDPSRLTRLLLSGVTALTRNTRVALDEHGVTWAGEAIKPYVEKADFFHTSNEVSFSPGCPSWEEQPLGAFCSKLEHFDLLTDIGLDIVELSGNHNLDYNAPAYLDTLDWYAEKGIQVIGGGADLAAARTPLTIQHNGSTITMLACNAVGPYYALAGETEPGAAACDLPWLRQTLPQLAEQSDLLILTVQYLEVEDYLPTQQQRYDFRGFADLGADVVIGTQAHKPQTFEFYGSARGEESFIHYGLGNLFFDQPFWGNMRFFMDELFIYEGRLLTVDLFTGIIDDLARPRPMTADEQLNFLAFMFNTQGGM